MTTFSDLGLSPETLRAVTEAGYTEPTPIQSQAIPIALAGRDILGIAQTGTGKTASFTLPMIDRLAMGRSKARMPRSLILTPTRELAAQVSESFVKYGKNHKLTMALLIGGVGMADQVQALARGIDVLIATPGRLLDLFERGNILLTAVQILVVDEADRMLDMGFIPDIERIFKLTPPHRQTLFFSATMPPEITRLTEQFLRDPVRIEASRPASTATTIKQFVTPIPRGDPKAKRAALRALVGRGDVKNGIIFCNRKTDVDIVAKSLSVHGFDASPIHGDLDQAVRTKTLDRFRSGELKLLVASDVAARGLDIPDVSHVFNYDVPFHADDYVHRIGRTGRAGKSGQAFMLTTPHDSKTLSAVLKLIKVEPEILELDIEWPEAENRRGPAGKSGAHRAGSARPGASRGDASRGGSHRKGYDRGDAEPSNIAERMVASGSERSGSGSEQSDAGQSDAGQSDAGRSGRGRSRSGSSRRNPSMSAGETANDMANDMASDMTEAAAEPMADRADRTRRPRAAEPMHQRPDRDSSEPRRSSGRDAGNMRVGRGKSDDSAQGDKIVGFGAEIPAFLQGPAKGIGG